MPLPEPAGKICAYIDPFPDFDLFPQAIPNHRKPSLDGTPILGASCVVMTAAAEFEIATAVNKCHIDALSKASVEPDCTEFLNCVVNVQCAIIHTYQMVAFMSVRESDPKKASELWKMVVDICDDALKALRELVKSNEACGTQELYDLALEYRGQANKRFFSESPRFRMPSDSPGVISSAELDRISDLFWRFEGASNPLSPACQLAEREFEPLLRSRNRPCLVSCIIHNFG